MIERYTTREMSRIFSDEHKFTMWLHVERIVAEVESRAGIIPSGLSRRIGKVKVDPRRVDAIERVVNHDVIAFLHAVREKLGREGKWLHFGLTSYDLVDTAFVLVLKEALTIVSGEINGLLRSIDRLSRRYWKTPQMGRTHGVFAQPITFGYKARSWYEEVMRAYKRMQSAIDEISYGKLSGAVGAYTMLAPVLEKKVMHKLGLKPEPVSTQVLPRDRFAHLMAVMALYACAIERIATEIRNLTRTEIGELAEPFTAGQKGSSAMPHKKNPITCERISGLARILRGYLIPAFENINLWHERDITNSSVERIIIPDAFHLVHYLTVKMRWVLENLTVNTVRMRENINMSCGVYASQYLMNRLIERGLDREVTYRHVQLLSFKAVQNKVSLEELAKKDKKILKYLKPHEIRAIFSINYFLRNIYKKH